ncbi:unnamed protein product [Phytophthora fragariaefolia]|uniref:Unnamed protein product n=1 Tax=Phytophthora fragariaefolia TaxID=1490495 RepID=A0A9W7CS19_9STRA|nr:unnamed protein product [Phytophthora fragariaefolia]
MVPDASREEIRDDNYYRSLLLGPRVALAVSPTATSSPSSRPTDGSAHTLLALKTSTKNPNSIPLPTQNGTIIKRRKRNNPVESEEESGTTEYEPNDKEKRTTKRKYRKATHTLRKEEKERLQRELDGLHARMEELKKQALASFGTPGQNDQERVIASKVLRDAVQTQQLEFANIQGIMSEYALCVSYVFLFVEACARGLTLFCEIMQTIEAGSPLQNFIHLGRDAASRRDTLLALKPMKLDVADDFLRQRRPHVDPCRAMCEDRRYELSNGDFCSTRFTTIQFHGVGSVKQVFDMLVQYFCNIEISISEKLGHITVREDDDNGGKGVTQNRLVSTTINGLLMESNTVLFSQFYEPDNKPGHERGRGLIVADFVDEDERHPYIPQERVRRDINAILELTSYTRKVAPIGGSLIERQTTGEEQSVVVLTRWVFSQLHRPSFSVSSEDWEEMRDNMDRWGETMHRTMIESLTSNI